MDLGRSARIVRRPERCSPRRGAHGGGHHPAEQADQRHARYKDREEKATAKGLRAGKAYSFSIFTVDSETTPLASTPVTHVLRASKLSLKVSSSSLTYGKKVKLTGKLTVPNIGDGLQKVEIYAQRLDTKQWYSGSSALSTRWSPARRSPSRSGSTASGGRPPGKTSASKATTFKVKMTGRGQYLFRIAAPKGSFVPFPSPC